MTQVEHRAGSHPAPLDDTVGGQDTVASASRVDSPTGSLRRPLDEALGNELLHIEIRIAQVWQCVVGAGIVLSLVTGLRSFPAMAFWGSATGVVFLVWFTVVAVLLRRGGRLRAVRIATALVESTVPWVFLAVLALTQGPAYALESWVAPLLYTGLLVGSAARLRPIEPLILGVSGGLAFLVLYFAWLGPALPSAAAALPVFRPVVQISRGALFALGGVLAMLVARSLRRAIGRADSTARERELFGKYRLLNHIASGGMGTVYEALYCPEGGFQRSVAIKRIHPHLASEESFIAFFRNEAEITARLVHSNIVQVLDFGSVDGTYFLAMELVDGLTLRSFMKRASSGGITLPLLSVAHIGHEILAGLAYAHGTARAPDGSLLRVIHRDLCPANVLLSRTGEVKISDFGVARALRDSDSARTATVAGHHAYMAPEQARAEALDERTDLFALGIILWELVTGRALFDRGAQGPTILALMTEPVPRPSTLREWVPPAWDVFILRALEADPARRYPSASAMSAALAALPTSRDSGGEELRSLIGRVLDIPERAPVALADVGGNAPPERAEMPTRVARRGRG